VERCLRPLAAALAENIILACLSASGKSVHKPVPPPVDEKVQPFAHVLAFRGSVALLPPENQVTVLRAVNVIGRRWPEEDVEVERLLTLESSASESEEEPLAASTGLEVFSASLATTLGLDALGLGSVWSVAPSPVASRKGGKVSDRVCDEESARLSNDSIEVATGIGSEKLRGVSKDRDKRTRHINSALVGLRGARMGVNGVEKKRPSAWLDLGVPSSETLCAPEQATIYVDNAGGAAVGDNFTALRRGGVVLKVAGAAPNPTVVFRSSQGRFRALTLKPGDSLALRPGDVIELGELLSCFIYTNKIDCLMFVRAACVFDFRLQFLQTSTVLNFR
jgi:hypothetical protein